MIPNFLAALMALVASFSGSGKPADLPPASNPNFDTRGREVSNITADWNRGFTGASGIRLPDENSGDTGISGPTGEKGDSGPTGTTDAAGPQEGSGPTGATGATGSGIMRFDAVNLRSGISMPAQLPGNAIDRSGALDFPPTGTPYPTPSEQNNGDGQNSDARGRDFGQSHRP